MISVPLFRRHMCAQTQFPTCDINRKMVGNFRHPIFSSISKYSSHVIGEFPPWCDMETVKIVFTTINCLKQREPKCSRGRERGKDGFNTQAFINSSAFCYHACERDHNKRKLPERNIWTRRRCGRKMEKRRMKRKCSCMTWRLRKWTENDTKSFMVDVRLK